MNKKESKVSNCTEITDDTPIEDIISNIENSETPAKKGRKKRNKKKKKGQTQQSDHAETVEVVEQEIDDEEGKVLACLDNMKQIRTVSESTVMTTEAEEKKEEIEVKLTKDLKKKKSGGKNNAKSAPKKPEKKKFKLEKLELNDSFWDAYDSEYSSGSDVESIDDYKKDGYHPVFVGETFKNRYRVLKKLGWGAFSTVWFCHDMHQNKFVAIKVQKSGESYYSAAEDEIEILDVIADKWKSEEWKESISEYKLNANINSVHCMYMMDHFEFKGPNGKHIGMVFEIMGANLLTIMKKYDWEGIPLPIVRIMAR